jgi:hypothetical protein
MACDTDFQRLWEKVGSQGGRTQTRDRPNPTICSSGTQTTRLARYTRPTHWSAHGALVYNKATRVCHAVVSQSLSASSSVSAKRKRTCARLHWFRGPHRSPVAKTGVTSCRLPVQCCTLATHFSSHNRSATVEPPYAQTEPHTGAREKRRRNKQKPTNQQRRKIPLSVRREVGGVCKEVAEKRKS